MVWRDGSRSEAITRSTICGRGAKPQLRSDDRTLPRHINLRESKRGFQSINGGVIEDGQVFITDDHGPIDLIWKDATHLMIRATLSDPAVQEHTWRDITITYDPVPIVITHRETGEPIRRVLNLWGADLHGARLAGANLEREDLSRSNLQFADLRRANLQHTFLKSTDLRGANLAGADLASAYLDDVDLRGANLKGVNLMLVHYTRATRWPAGFDAPKYGATLLN